MKRFADLTEQEVLALAVSNEDEDNRIYRSFADGLALLASAIFWGAPAEPVAVTATHSKD